MDRRKPEERVRLRLYGAVQGVGFRYFVRQTARRHDIAGYVINRPDGAVELEAGGDADALERFRHTVEHGPPLARVERVETLEHTPEVLPLPFEVRRY
ncbi:MAG TPA: acylphosphatase [Longimicrobiales bacterium]